MSAGAANHVKKSLSKCRHAIMQRYIRFPDAIMQNLNIVFEQTSASNTITGNCFVIVGGWSQPASCLVDSFVSLIPILHNLKVYSSSSKHSLTHKNNLLEMFLITFANRILRRFQANSIKSTY